MYFLANLPTYNWNLQKINDKSNYEKFETLEKVIKALQQEKNYHYRIGGFKEFDKLLKYVIDIDGIDDNYSIEQILDELILFISEKCDTTLTYSDFAITYNDNYHNTGKASYHVVIKTKIDTVANQKIFALELDQNIFFNGKIDTSIYTGTNNSGKWFRMPNQKKSDGAPGLHRLYEGSNLEDFVLEYIPQDATELNLKKILENPSNIPQKKKPKIIIPKITNNNSIPVANKYFNYDKLQLFADLLDLVPEQQASDYNQWLKIMFIIKNELGEMGKDVSHLFSKKSNKYDEQKVNDFWDNKLNPKDIDNKASIASLYYICSNINSEETTKINKRYTSTLKNKLTILFTQDSLAKILQEEFGDDIVYIYEGNNKQKAERYGFEKNNWIIWDGIIRKKISEDLYGLLLANYPEAVATKYLNKLKDYKFQTNIVDAHRTFGKYRSKNEYDIDPDILAFKNTLYNLKTFQFIQRTYKDDVLFTTNYDWQEPTQDQLEKAHDILDKIFINKDVKELVLEILSTGLCGKNLQKFIIFIGKGRNGKGVLDWIMKHCLGDYYYSADNQLLTKEATDGPNPALANMAKKRYVIYDEVPSKPLQNNIIRKQTGGGNITARGLHQAQTEHKNLTTNVAATNELPRFRDELKPSDIDRLIIIDFPNKFVDNQDDFDTYSNMDIPNVYWMDKQIEEKIQSEYRCAFMKILMEANIRYEKRGHFLIPPEVKQFTDTYIKESSLLISWLQDNYENTGEKTDFIQLGQEYKSFFSICDANNKSKYKLKKNFFNFFIESKDYCNSYREKHNYTTVNGTKTSSRNVLIGWRKIINV